MAAEKTSDAPSQSAAHQQLKRQRSGFAAPAMVELKVEATGVHIMQVSQSLGTQMLLIIRYNKIPCCRCINHIWRQAAWLKWHRQIGRKQPLSDEKLRQGNAL